jgi:hypothetical protein
LEIVIMRVPALVATALAMLLLAPAAEADLDVSVRFSVNETSAIREFFHNYHVDKKGGKKGAKPLPPGIAKNLARGKPLPPGIAKRALPGELVAQLPPVADGYERVIVSGKILLVEIATQIVHDILTDILLD